MQPVMDVNLPTSTLHMEKSEGSSSSGPMKMSMRLLQTDIRIHYFPMWNFIGKTFVIGSSCDINR